MSAISDTASVICAVEDGAFVTVPIFETHRRGKNWLALIIPDPMAPGGLHRTFQARAQGRYLYLVAGISVGAAVEFGADYYSGGGTKRICRWYGVVREIDPGRVLIEKYATSRGAIAAARSTRMGE